MRARTQSFALMPATSTITTALLAVTWWLTMAGLTTAAPGEPLLWGTAAVLGTAIIIGTSDPRTGARLGRLIASVALRIRRAESPGVDVRWIHLRAASITSCRTEIESRRVGRPRAPGQALTTA